MKRFLCMCLVFVMMLSASSPAYGEETVEYSLMESAVTLSIPSEYTVLTQEELNEGDKPTDTIEDDTYLEANDADSNHSIMVRVTPVPIVDFEFLTEKQLVGMAESLKKKFQNAGADSCEFELYRQTENPFIKIEFTLSLGDITVYSVHYRTVAGGCEIDIIMMCFSGETSDGCKESLQEIVDSVEIDRPSKTPEDGFMPGDSFIFTDPVTQASFEVPENWIQYSLRDVEFGIDVAFSSLEDTNLDILYMGMDAWASLTEAQRRQISWADLDNSLYTRAILADTYSIPEDDITIVKYGDNEFFAMDLKDSIYGEELSESFAIMMLMDKGHMYTFRFSGGHDDPLYRDFEQLLSSFEPGSVTAKYWLDAAANNHFCLTLISFVLPIALYPILPQLAAVLR